MTFAAIKSNDKTAALLPSPDSGEEASEFGLILAWVHNSSLTGVDTDMQ
jgi:hypothetical protein